MAHSHATFTQGNLMGHVARMSFTSSIGLMAIFAVNLVDMIFIAMLGNAALAAAVGYAGTILFFTNAVNIGLSIAAGTLVARAIGADDEHLARQQATSVATYALIVGILLPALIYANLDWCLAILGAEGETVPLARSYLTILLPTTAFMGIAMTAMAVLRAHGDAKLSMYSTLFGGIVNAILDPIFIFTLDFGLEGAAAASVFARVVTLGVALYPAIKVYDAFAWPSLEHLNHDTKRVASIAAPAVMANVASPLGSAIVMREMTKYGTDAVAAIAIIGRLVPVAFSVVFALSGAVGPILGQNFGANLTSRVKEGFIAALKFAFIYTICVSIVLFLTRGLLADLFGATGEVRDLLYLFCGPIALTYFFNGAIFVSNASFNNLGHPFYSTMVNWGTYTLGTWPFVVAGSAIGGAPGILIGQAMGAIVFGIGATIVGLRVTATAVPKEHVADQNFPSRVHTLHVQRRP